MRNIFSKTFGGLNAYYYFRHFFFGLVFASFMIVMVSTNKNSSAMSIFETKALLIVIFNTALYPYAHLVFEKITNFILGENEIWTGLLIVITMKVLWTSVLWMLAIFLAPIGLIYLYFLNSKKIDVILQ